MNDMFLELVSRQLERMPSLTVQDLVKALYQSEFGCGHFVTDEDKGMTWLQRELEGEKHAARQAQPPFIEALGNNYCRIHLSSLAESGLAPQTLFKLFALSAEAPSGDMTHFVSLLDRLEQLIVSGETGLDIEASLAFLAGYREAGCPATHHSEAFRSAYAPAYRVIRSDYARLIPLFAAADRLLAAKERVILAVEGGSASGKSTLGGLLQAVYGCTLFHMDDFFLQMHQRTPERFAEPGGNVDRERFLAEVLDPLTRGDVSFAYRVFDCSRMELGESITVEPGRLCVVEGAYSMHPALAGAYDLSVFLEIDPDEQARRILLRNGESMQQRFLNEWIPLEHAYFDQLRVKERCTLIL